MTRSTDHTTDPPDQRQRRFQPPPFAVDFQPLLERIRRRDPEAAAALLELTRDDPFRTWAAIRGFVRLLQDSDGPSRLGGAA